MRLINLTVQCPAQSAISQSVNPPLSCLPPSPRALIPIPSTKRLSLFFPPPSPPSIASYPDRTAWPHCPPSSPSSSNPFFPSIDRICVLPIKLYITVLLLIVDWDTYSTIVP